MNDKRRVVGSETKRMIDVDKCWWRILFLIISLVVLYFFQANEKWWKLNVLRWDENWVEIKKAFWNLLLCKISSNGDKSKIKSFGRLDLHCQSRVKTRTRETVTETKSFKSHKDEESRRKFIVFPLRIWKVNKNLSLERFAAPAERPQTHVQESIKFQIFCAVLTTTRQANIR